MGGNLSQITNIVTVVVIILFPNPQFLAGLGKKCRSLQTNEQKLQEIYCASA